MPDFIEPVANTLAHPPLQLVRPHLQPELLSGSGQLPRFAQPANGISYGGIFTAQTVPPHLGRTSANRPRYDLALMTLWLLERTQTGVAFATSAIELHEPEDVIRWFSFPLAAIEYDVLPGVTFAWSYLLLS
jgi:hypothetical protein